MLLPVYIFTMELKPKKGFVQAQLNIEKLTPIQWDGIMRAMDAYADHFHAYKTKTTKEPCHHPMPYRKIIFGVRNYECTLCGKYVENG
jgi:hypothetical protein